MLPLASSPLLVSHLRKDGVVAGAAAAADGAAAAVEETQLYVRGLEGLHKRSLCDGERD
jgi:hypothetical protein